MKEGYIRLEKDHNYHSRIAESTIWYISYVLYLST